MKVKYRVKGTDILHNFISHMVQMKASQLKHLWTVLRNFISHMVQMKGQQNVKVCCSSLPLYPTWFRWKYTYTDGSRTERIALYIPHGSDERYCKKEFKWDFTKLYIPHGSDESAVTLETLCPVSQLYIPHGSDERMRSFSMLKKPFRSLYPTWFRWKYTL